MENCLFCKIVEKKIPKEFRFEDEKILAFDDINPVASTHILFVPKTHIDSFDKLEDDSILNSLRIGVQSLIGEKSLIGKGYKIVVNGGGAQVVNHLHFHLIGPIGFNAKLN